MPMSETQSLREIQEEAHGITKAIPGAPTGQKAGSKKVKPLKKVPTNATIDLSVRGIEINSKGKVILNVMQIVTIPPADLEGESETRTRPYKMGPLDDQPHEDLFLAMKGLRRDALKICEIEVDSKDIGNYTVCKIQIAGDLLLKQCRVTLTIGKLVKRTGKIVLIKTPQTTLYGQSEYEGADKLAPLIEKAVDEIEKYMHGKFAGTNVHQLPLFPKP
jgi:hypothetical protein